jgi:group II intron reverse transcriptase/maturase
MDPREGTTSGPPNPGSVSLKLSRIAELAGRAEGRAFTSLAHFIDIDWLREAYRRTRKDGAAGVDGQTAEDYAANLEENLQSLLDRAKSGTYRAPPVRRVHIPKGDGSKTRPIGIPGFEDKVLQRAVAMVLEAVYETEFLDGSYGFRPGRNAHQALASLWKQTMRLEGGWVIDADIKGFFDTIDHSHLVAMLRQRVRDGVLLRLIGKWLNAGVMEGGQVTHPEAGTPQGGVISPILANIYLHEVLDVWFEQVVRPRLRGAAHLIRYADDFVIVCALERDAIRVLNVLPKRFGKYGLTLHPEKTKLVPFRRPGPPGRGDVGGARPGTFDLLGFTHYWGLSRKGSWVLKRKTTAARFTRAVRAITAWCKRHRHRPVAEQAKALGQRLRGHCAYYGITGNSAALARFNHELRKAWWKWLNRRSQKARLKWEAFAAMLRRYPLPRPIAVHSVLRRAANP